MNLDQLLTEISQNVINALPVDLEDNLDYIFGSKTRIAEKVGGGSKYTIPIQDILDDFDIDFQSWVAYKKEDTDKKNPTKLNKALNKKMSLLKKQGGDADQISKIETLLNTYDLKAQAQAVETPLYVIFSRSPVDVVRMSDHKYMSSCHSEGGDYFACAVADAMNNAGVAYLVTEEVFDMIDDLQAEEIFEDNDRGTGTNGVAPLARIRLRKLIDRDSNQQVVPSLKLYGRSEYQKVFTDYVSDWVKTKINPKFKWDDTLTLKGGSYEDAGVGVVTMAEKIFGKSIKSYSADDEDDYQDEFGQGNNNEELEQYWDAFKDAVENSIKNEDTDVLEFYDIDMQDSRLTVYLKFESYTNSEALSQLVPENDVIEGDDFKKYGLEKLENGGVVRIELYSDMMEFIFDTNKLVEVYEYFEYYGVYDVASNPDEYVNELSKGVQLLLSNYVADEEIYIDMIAKAFYIPKKEREEGVTINMDSINRYFKIMDDTGFSTEYYDTSEISKTMNEGDLTSMVRELVNERLKEVSPPEKLVTMNGVFFQNEYAILKPEITKDLIQVLQDRHKEKITNQMIGSMLDFYNELNDPLTPKEKTSFSKFIGERITLPTVIENRPSEFSPYINGFSIDFSDVFEVQRQYSDEDLKNIERFADMLVNQNDSWVDDGRAVFYRNFKKITKQYIENIIMGNDPDQSKFDFYDKLQEAKSFKDFFHKNLGVLSEMINN